MLAVKRVEGWRDHVVTDLSHAVTDWQSCWWAIFHPTLQAAVDASIRAILSSEFHVVVLYGAKVAHRFSAENLQRVLPGIICSAVLNYRGVYFYAVRTPAIPATLFSAAIAASTFWVIESPHPAYWRREGRVYAAVQLAELLMAQAHPQNDEEYKAELIVQPDVEELDSAMEAATAVFGKEGRQAMDEWEAEELEERDELELSDDEEEGEEEDEADEDDEKEGKAQSDDEDDDADTRAAIAASLAELK